MKDNRKNREAFQHQRVLKIERLGLAVSHEFSLKRCKANLAGDEATGPKMSRRVYYI